MLLHRRPLHMHLLLLTPQMHTELPFPCHGSLFLFFVLVRTLLRAALHRAASPQCPPGDLRLPPLARTTAR